MIILKSLDDALFQDKGFDDAGVSRSLPKWRGSGRFACFAQAE